MCERGSFRNEGDKAVRLREANGEDDQRSTQQGARTHQEGRFSQQHLRHA